VRNKKTSQKIKSTKKPPLQETSSNSTSYRRIQLVKESLKVGKLIGVHVFEGEKAALRRITKKRMKGDKAKQTN